MKLILCTYALPIRKRKQKQKHAMKMPDARDFKTWEEYQKAYTIWEMSLIK